VDEEQGPADIVVGGPSCSRRTARRVSYEHFGQSSQ
jgi:hypothetical protein